MTFWSVGPFWYMVYGIWYVVYGMKMAFTVYSHMFRVRRTQAAYNVVHLFLVKIFFITGICSLVTMNMVQKHYEYLGHSFEHQ